MKLEIHIVASNDDAGEIHSLHDWLSGEPDLAATSIEIEIPKISYGEMGALSDALIVTFGAGGAGAVLARSLSVWLQTRTTELKIRLTTSKGTLEVDGKRIRQPEVFFDEVTRLIEGSSDEPA